MIIGRKKELRDLEDSFNSREAEFIVIFGRRRVGKTYLIKEFFKKKTCTFMCVTGQLNMPLKIKMQRFAKAFSEVFNDNKPIRPPKSWEEAFSMLHDAIQQSSKKVVIFFDEVSWLASKKSCITKSIEYYWNHYWHHMPQVVLIVCGSAASWMINRFIDDTGGFHGRASLQLPLSAFSLCEAREFLRSRGVFLNDDHVLSLYMAMGGIPYYLKHVKPGLSAAQNIQKIFFDKGAPLYNEFERLFTSLFTNAEAHIEIMQLIAQHRSGISRADLEKSLGAGGSLSRKLRNLSKSEFIQAFIPFGARARGEYYRLTDEFCLFYLYWIDRHSDPLFSRDYWITQSSMPVYYAWSEFAFEVVCLNHAVIITSALKVISCGPLFSWRYVPRTPSERGAQIDLVIDRTDNAITLCEIKYTNMPFRIDKRYAQALQRKIDVFTQQTTTTKQILLALVSANGVTKSKYLEKLGTQVLTLEDLFEHE